MAFLNYHHLRYFWAVAREGNLTRAAAALRVAPSALSSQIRQLQGQLGEPLFTRKGRALELTEGGRIVLDYAESIFATGEELLATLKDGRRRAHALKVGAVATLSRNFQDSFLAPVLDDPAVSLTLASGALEDLVHRLAEHALDLVLANKPVQAGRGRPLRSRLVARQKVSLIGHRRRQVFRFPKDLPEVPLILPGPDSALRGEFDALCEKLGVQVRVKAEVDDMAMMRLLARDSEAVALVPPVVVRDELQAGVLRELCGVPGLSEDFYAVTVERRYQHPLVTELLRRSTSDILGDEARRG